MGRFKVSIFSVLLCLPSVTYAAQRPLVSTYVFCAYKDNNLYWRWIVNENNRFVTINGYWKKVLYKDIGSSKKNDLPNYSSLFAFNPNSYAFVTSYTEYLKVKKYCRHDEVLQPADSSFSDWYGFELVKSL